MATVQVATKAGAMHSLHENHPVDVVDQKEDDTHHVEKTDTILDNLVYTDADEEPELHTRTFIALAALFILNLTLTVAVQGPPTVVR